MRFKASISGTVAAVGLLVAMQAEAYCFREAGSRYGIDPQMLRAIAYTESALRADIESHTGDIGLMGINRSWLSALEKRFGLKEQDVWEPCVNVQIGAWILAQSYRQYGKNWNAVGAYNASCRRLKGSACLTARAAYADKVYRNWNKLRHQPF